MRLTLAQTFFQRFRSDAVGSSFNTVRVNNGGDDQSDPGVEVNDTSSSVIITNHVYRQTSIFSILPGSLFLHQILIGGTISHHVDQRNRDTHDHLVQVAPLLSTQIPRRLLIQMSLIWTGSTSFLPKALSHQ